MKTVVQDNTRQSFTPIITCQEMLCAGFKERRGSVMVSTFACHAADPGSIPGPGMCHY